MGMLQRTKYICLIAAVAGMFCLPGLAQSPRYTLFGGALLGSPSGFTVGGGLDFAIAHNVSFDPSIAGGRTGSAGVFTAQGVFDYSFHPDDEAFIPYILGGVGLAEVGSVTHGSVIAGVGVRFPIGNGEWIVPEVQVGDHGLGRFTIGFSKSF